MGVKKPIVQASFEEGKSEVLQLPSGVKVGQCIRAHIRRSADAYLGSVILATEGYFLP